MSFLRGRSFQAVVVNQPLGAAVVEAGLEFDPNYTENYDTSEIPDWVIEGIQSAWIRVNLEYIPQLWGSPEVVICTLRVNGAMRPQGDENYPAFAKQVERFETWQTSVQYAEFRHEIASALWNYMQKQENFEEFDEAFRLNHPSFNPYLAADN